MKNKSAWILIFVLTVSASCRKVQKPSPVRADFSPTGTAGIAIPSDSPLLNRIRIEAVPSAAVSINEVSAPGQIEFDASRVARVHLPVSGRVERVFVQLGESVRAGQPVMTVDSPEVEEAFSAYRQSLSAVVQARATLAKSTSDRNRTNDLFEHKAAARKDVMSAENDLAIAQAAADQAEAAREQSRRRLEILGLGQKEAGSRLTIAAPLSGKVIALSITAGEYRNDTAEPVMTVADLSSVWVLSEIPETSIRLIEMGERIQIELVAYPEKIFEARVIRIADTLDPRTRTVQVRAELPNPSGKLRPGMFGRIRHMHPPTLGPVVPETAVYRRGPDACVFVERNRGQFERVPVKLGTAINGHVPVLEGIKAGDRVVVEGVMLLAGLEGR